MLGMRALQAHHPHRMDEVGDDEEEEDGDEGVFWPLGQSSYQLLAWLALH